MKKEIHRNPVSWWDPECDKAKRLRKASFKKYQFTDKLKDHIDYKKHIAVAKKTFNEKKKKYYRKFASQINFNTSKKFVWDKTKILKNKWTKITPSHT